MNAINASTTLSIVIATRNAAGMLCTTLASMAKKTSFSYEILIQDATSTDNTDAIIKKFHTLPIKFASAPDGGIYDAWNKALARRCGEWAIFIGAGDIVCWKNLERCIKIIKKLPQTVDFYITPVKLITNAGRVLTILSPSRSPIKSLPQEMPFPHPGVFHRSSVFCAHDFDQSYRVAGDYDFFCRALKKDNFAMGDTVVTSMLAGGVSGCLESMSISERELLQIAQKHFPASIPWKPFLRLSRSKLYLVIKKLFGTQPANLMADIPRILEGKPRLWSIKEAKNIMQIPCIAPLPRLSLLIATVARRTELDNLLTSLEKQTYKNFHIAIADQNAPGYLDPVLARHALLPIVRIMLPSKGVSLARNALLAHAEGDIIAFPDDDCWYAPDTLESVVAAFHAAPRCGALLGVWTPSPETPRPNLPEGEISRRGLFRLAGTCVQFYRNEAIAGLRFDPILGPGTGLPYGSGEDTDFLLQVSTRTEVHRCASVRVFHPSPKESIPASPKVTAYAAGRMYLLQKHRFPFWFVLANILFPLVRLPIDGARHGRAWAWYRWRMFRERLRSWSAPSP